MSAAESSDGPRIRHIRLPVLGSTSPSLSELMRLCMLRAGLSRAGNIQDLVLGNPKAWLGTAYHETLAALASAADGQGVEELWNRAIDRQYQRARLHPLDQRFGPPPSWPGYHVILATLTLRAQELNQHRAPIAGPGRAAGRNSYRETRFSACGGKLVGKPDLVSATRIVDYKTGSLTEGGSASESTLREGYVRQLRLYAFLVHESVGFWPEHAELAPLHGPAVRIGIEESACRAEASDAISLLDRYNLVQAGDPELLASPSPAACKWCPFKLLCNPFWRAVTAAWSGQLDGDVVEGAMPEPPRAIHAGLAARIVIATVGGTLSGRIAVMPIKPEELASAGSGSVVRATGLYRRADGTVTPNIRTSFAMRADIPVLVAGAST